MAGKIIADTIETGAGADISTSYVVNGSAKAWANMNGTGTIALRDSLNASSLTDHSAGIYTTSWTNSFADTEYATTTATNLDQAYSGDMCIVTQATGSLKHKTYYGAGHAGTDASINCHTNFGDLA